MQGQAKFGNIITDFFEIEEGVKQGCVLSPVLFCIYINEFAKMIKESAVGVRICNVQTGCLFWADDVILIADNNKDLQTMLNIAASFSNKWKLSFNHDKSNVVVVGQRGISNTRWLLGSKRISEVSQYRVGR